MSKKALLVFVDIDGTVAHWGRRKLRAGEEPSREDKDTYESWLERLQSANTLLQDPEVKGMSTFIRGLASHPENAVIYLTARDNKWREVTDLWLYKHGFPPLDLIMRPSGNYMEAADLKKEVIFAALEKHPEAKVIVIDDDSGVETMCRSFGFTCLKATSGGS